MRIWSTDLLKSVHFKVNMYTQGSNDEIKKVTHLE